MKSLICFINPPEVVECLLVSMVNDTYQELNTQNKTRKWTGEDHITVIGGFEMKRIFEKC